MSERFKIIPGVALIVERGDTMLLLRRTENCSWPHYYCLVGGHVDGGETMRQAIAREAFEEVGITIKPEDLIFRHVIHRYDPQGEIVVFIFEAKHFEGEPYNKEPEKHSELIWAPKHQLPEPLFPSYANFLHKKEAYYSEFGW